LIEIKSLQDAFHHSVKEGIEANVAAVTKFIILGASAGWMVHWAALKTCMPENLRKEVDIGVWCLEGADVARENRGGKVKTVYYWWISFGRFPGSSTLHAGVSSDFLKKFRNK
jgi:hypothetical protein